MPRHSTLISAFMVWAVGVACPGLLRADECAFLMITDAQAGFAGTTGTIWSIASDCTFTVSRFVNDKISEPHTRGRLTQTQYVKLASVLAEKAAASLPAQIGEPAKVNAHRTSLTYAGKTSVLELDPGSSRTEVLNANPTDPARRFLDIREAVKRATGTVD
jgi:hypothetical protein